MVIVLVQAKYPNVSSVPKDSSLYDNRDHILRINYPRINYPDKLSGIILSFTLKYKIRWKFVDKILKESLSPFPRSDKGQFRLKPFYFKNLCREESDPTCTNTSVLQIEKVNMFSDLVGPVESDQQVSFYPLRGRGQSRI